MRFRIALVGTMAVLLALMASVASAQPLLVEERPLKVDIRGQTYELEAIVVRPATAAGPLPVAILTHGSPRSSADRAGFKAASMLGQARDLAHRGWLAVAFLRRGFGGLPNRFVEGYDCRQPDYRKALLTAADDIEAVRAAIIRRPDVDSSRVLGMGVSVGGASMLAWAAGRPEGLVGIVNVSGGTGSPATNANCDAAQLVSVVGGFGAAAAVPSIWFYAANDGYFGPELAGRMHAGYVGRGGKAELVSLPAIGEDGHSIWGAFAGRERWLPELDRFLRANHLPVWNPEPAERLRAELNGEARRVFARYLNAPAEKALAVSRLNGIARFWSGTRDIEESRKGAVDVCQRDTGESCRVVFENFSWP